MSNEDKTNELPEPSFTSLILFLSTMAMQQLGIVKNPITNKVEKNLPMAKYTIDILEILKEKTKGNLTKDEEDVISNVLHELRMAYINVKK